MKKRAFLVLLSFLLAIPLFGVNNTAKAATTFTDVGASHRAAKEIYYLAQGGIAQGASATEFGPNKRMTRAEAAALIGRALQLNGTKRVTSFKDVGSGMFASGYIQSAAEKGILSGYSDKTFHPYQEVTRGEMAVMISKAFGYEYGNTLSGAANALKSRGIAQGKTDGSFGASERIIRADFSVFLARAINPKFRLVENTVTFKDARWINVDSLNVRTGPNDAYPKVGAVKQDQQVKSAYKVGAWNYIQYGSIEGFVHGSYLRDTAEAKPAGVDPRIAKQVVVLDPGHGGRDSGATGFGIYEKNVVLDTGLKVNNLFKQTPFQVKMTRSTDKFVELRDRVSYAKSVGANTFISIHANAGGGTGSETYYYSAYKNPNVADSKLLATKIQNRLVAAWNLADRGVKNGNFHVIRENTMPAVLVELGFIDRKADNDKLRSDYWRNAAAKAIYLGTLDYYKAKGYEVDGLYDVVK
ncbi:N-acetylmuramoyl-L-alanine amidase [Bacillus badius]|uniref:N-acetylmuramoyl-L-alanine amidase n=1 Tax=Bacillus badius TaxID=1455 RepID=A0ABR5AVH1_BACBA|nr:N-acetylmuramoyl-L-alanine amidase [Bacillus badius]KIL78639.1 N-acetylmuramoyl-L-alanine amidase [Bacillus badius]MED4717530.1 N-acetylmuramoyl-L-alanine amidase [Bacillus badius]